MNLKLKRLVRTPTSEQYALFDLDQLADASSSAQPATIGKLDLHFTAEGMYGTLLVWDAAIGALPAAERRAFARALLADLAQPMGVPNEYVVEFFAPTLDQYEVIHNVGLDEDDADDDSEDELPDAEAISAPNVPALPDDDSDLDDEFGDDLRDDLPDDLSDSEADALIYVADLEEDETDPASINDEDD